MCVVSGWRRWYLFFDVGLGLLICCYCCLVCGWLTLVEFVGWFDLVYLVLHALCCLTVVGSGLAVLIVWGLLPGCDLVLADFCWLVCISCAWMRLFRVLLDSFCMVCLVWLLFGLLLNLLGRVCYLLWWVRFVCCFWFGLLL